jgi:hypothetical protein
LALAVGEVEPPRRSSDDNGEGNADGDDGDDSGDRASSSPSSSSATPAITGVRRRLRTKVESDAISVADSFG